MLWSMVSNEALRSNNRRVQSKKNVIYLFNKGSFGGMTDSESWLKMFQKIIVKKVAWKLLGHNSFQDYRRMVNNYLEFLGQDMVS